MYCTVQYFTVLYCDGWNGTVVYYTIPCSVLNRTIRYRTIVYHAVWNCTVLGIEWGLDFLIEGPFIYYPVKFHVVTRRDKNMAGF